MLIDWFTVVAQGFNFLVLVWLLKRYLYKPVLAAIDAREKQIALAIADATSQRTAAEQERATFAAKNAALDGERAALLNQAASAADAERTRLLAEARAEVDALRAKQMAEMRGDQTRLSEGIARLAQQEVLAIARKVLKDMAGASLEGRMAVLFAQRLRTLDKSAKETMVAAFGSSPGALVRSAFDLSEAQRTLIQDAVNEEFAASIQLRFEISAEMLCGVELSAGGQKLAWSMADYLGVLEKKIVSLSAPEHAVPTP
jgi:F-type H+-transporting ATPase subunit b